jgi:hypothetical protein
MSSVPTGLPRDPLTEMAGAPPAATLYIVCSPCRGVGKTLVARLLTEFHDLDERPVGAFDLADEGPQLADYLPAPTTLADIGDAPGQMALFDRLLATRSGATIIDLSHRAFQRFFTVVEEIGFFEEARYHAIEPLILFVVDSDPKSAQSYAKLHRSFPEASLLPVHNRTAERELMGQSVTATSALTSLDIPLLGFQERALVARPALTFAELWQSTPAGTPDATCDALRDWMEDVFLQFRALERWLAGEVPPMHLTAPTRRRTRTTRRRPLPRGGGSPPTDVPEQVLQYAPKGSRLATSGADQSGNAIVAKLHAAATQLRAAEGRIDQLESEIERAEDRAARAETWLHLIRKEIEERLIAWSDTARSKSPT